VEDGLLLLLPDEPAQVEPVRLVLGLPVARVGVRCQNLEFVPDVTAAGEQVIDLVPAGATLFHGELHGRLPSV
jgi:hypothetical protein